MEEKTKLDIRIDVEDLTIDEMEKLEEITGMAFGNIPWDGMPAKVMRALAWIFAVRIDPEFTLEEAGQVRILSLMKPNVAEESEADEDPTRLLSVNGVG